MKFDKSPQWLIELFDALRPEVGGERRVMFGYPVAFENGHLFAGLFGDGLFVKLDDTGRGELLSIDGARPFAPMGRPSKDGVMLPPAKLEDEEFVKSWLRRALSRAQSLPPKAAKARKRKRARSS